MGIFEIEKLTCRDCIWGTQCPAETICADFDPLLETDACWDDKEEFISEYDNYIKKRQYPCTEEAYSPSLTALLLSIAEVK